MKPMDLVELIRDRLQGRAPKGKRRSSHWRNIRAHHLREHPRCHVCGGKKKLQVHHLIPFWVAPDLELEPTNLITLCEAGKYGVKCHLLFGHLGNFSRVNTQCEADAAEWRVKFRTKHRLAKK